MEDVTQNTEVAETAVTAPPAVDSGTQVDTDAGGEPEWKPNLKVKAYDKEYDIPEKFHKLIDKDNEKDFRDTFEKAYALDVMKEKNSKIRAENESFKTRIEKEFMPSINQFKKLERFLANNDYDNFFANIPAFKDPVVLQKYMLRALQQNDLPADQQAVYNEARAAKQRAYELEDERNSLKQQSEIATQAEQQAAIDATLNRLDESVAKPEIAAIAKEFDSRLGQDGSYKMEVLRKAAELATKLQRDVSIEEAVEHFNKMLGVSPQSAQPAQAQGQNIPAPKPTLPSLNGRATSPANQKVKTIADLKKIRDQIIAQESRQSRE